MKKKKKKLSIVLIILAVIAVFPVYTGTFKDGGTKVFSALTYKIVCWNRLTGYDTYSKTRIYFLPHNFKSIDSLWYMESNGNESHTNNETGKNNEPLPTHPVATSAKTQEEIATKADSVSNYENIATEKCETIYEPTGTVANTVAVSDPLLPKDSVLIEAEILRISKSSILVKELDGYSQYDLTVSEKVVFIVGGNYADINDFKVGDKVRVHFKYPIAESFPMQVKNVVTVSKQ